MKTILMLSFLVLSLQASAYVNGTKVVGKKIQSPLRKDVCHLDVNGGASVCSAVRLSTDYVLTAEHCARGLNGKENTLKLDCNGDYLEIEKVYESKEYLKKFDPKERNAAKVSSNFDFAVIKLKEPNKFTPQFKLLKNFSEFQSILLNSPTSSTYNFSENTYCEFHGYGQDAQGNIEHLNSTYLDSTEKFNDESYLMKVELINSYSAYLESPYLPERTKDFLHSTVRPGDSGGPMFCKSKSGEMILSGIASTYTSGECEQKFQKVKTGFFKPAVVNCNQNRWGVPTKEVLEKTLGVILED